MGMLLPNLAHWRFLSILNDLWGPMNVTLEPLEVCLSAFRMPHLERLGFMRCDYAARAAVDSGHGPGPFSVTTGAWHWKLPRLRHLALRSTKYYVQTRKAGSLGPSD
ncbi:hypothetical protein C8R45DRAFT_1163752 [Mycena sanguinolenta]|nr:hypothetical protein C8R45DRAFT_1163752 [Mycena sanguinolenta]